MTRIVMVLGLLVPAAAAAVPPQAPYGAEDAFSGIPAGRARVISFATHEGTEMTVDASPDGKWLVFDLLGHIYRLPTTGGVATDLTADAGVALSFQPRISPDGMSIAFISDRNGQNNVWLMDSEGRNPRPVTDHQAARYFDPAWAPDGKSVVVARADATPGRGWVRRTSSIDLVPIDGGKPREIVTGEHSGRLEQVYAPDFSKDGKTLYIHAARIPYGGSAMYQVDHRIEVVQLGGTRSPLHARSATVRADRPLAADDPNYNLQHAYRWYINGDTQEIRPQVSPDGRYLAYAKDLSDRVAIYEGRSFYHRTVLVLRDLPTGKEQVIADPIEKALTDQHFVYQDVQLPRFGWSHDAYFSWTDDRLPQFASGRRIELFDPPLSRRWSYGVKVRLSRDVGNGRLVLRNAQIVSINDKDQVLLGDVVVDGARISCVGRCEARAADRAIDLRGATIIPGLIDVHDHLLTEGEAISQHRTLSALPLAYGVTTINDPSVRSESLFSIGDLVALAKLRTVRPGGSTT